MSIKISVIVPVYNAELYLTECMESLVHQTMPASDMEILAVNDCSTDKSEEILKQYASRYAQIKLLKTQKNSGPGGARNMALDAACGEFIGFVDSDDAVTPVMFEHMYQVAVEGNYDIVDAGIYYQSKDLAMVHTADEDTGEQTSEKSSHNIVSGGYLMTRIYRRDFWEKQGVRFRENAILEDMETLMYLNATAKRIGNLKEICYVYRNTAGSASKETQYEKYQSQAMSAMRATYEQMHRIPDYDGIQEAVEYAIIQLYSYALTNCLLQKGKIPEDVILKQQKQLGAAKEKYVSRGYENVYVQNKISQQNIQIMKMNDENPKNLFRLINV